MAWDALNMFTKQTTGVLFQTITADAASTNVIDLDKANIDISSGQKSVYLVAKVIAAFNTLTSMEVFLETSTAVAGTYIQVAMKNIALADLAVGALIFNEQMPVVLWRRFIRMRFNVIGSDPTLGTIIAGLTDGPETAEAPIDNVNIG